MSTLTYRRRGDNLKKWAYLFSLQAWYLVQALKREIDLLSVGRNATGREH